jgi:hypothetical protein
VHWTYAACAPESDLDQGDFLSPTPALTEVLHTVHPHFCDAKYLGFIVATQSCDLVRRSGGPPSASYISIAAVRSLRQVLPRLLRQELTPLAPDVAVFPTGAKREAKRLLARILDQNETALGLFYLHEDADLRLGESAVAFLRVKVALRADHYGVLLKARAGCLIPEFRAKLGWLIGNLYSRAATRDWSDTSDGPRRREAIIDAYLKDDRTLGPAWIEDSVVEAAQAAGPIDGKDVATVCEQLERHKPTPKVEQIADLAAREALRVLEKTPSGLDPEALATFKVKVRQRLINNGELKKLSRSK